MGVGGAIIWLSLLISLFISFIYPPGLWSIGWEFTICMMAPDLDSHLTVFKWASQMSNAQVQSPQACPTQGKRRHSQAGAWESFISPPPFFLYIYHPQNPLAWFPKSRLRSSSTCLHFLCLYYSLGSFFCLSYMPPPGLPESTCYWELWQTSCHQSQSIRLPTISLPPYQTLSLSLEP